MKLERRLKTSSDVLVQLAEDLFSGKIELDTWIVSSADTLKELAMINAKIARGGFEFTDDDLKILRSYLKDTFLNGEVIARKVNEDGTVTKEKKTYGLKKLLTEIERGDVTGEQLKARMEMYANHSRIVGSEIEANKRKDLGYKEVLNILGETKGTGTNHSDICIAATASGWMAIDEFKNVYGLAPRHSQCRCTQVFR